MLAERSIEGTTVNARVREAGQAARALIGRAAYLEKLAGRPRTDPTERTRLTGRARELRGAAELLLSEICELSRQPSV